MYKGKTGTRLMANLPVVVKKTDKPSSHGTGTDKSNIGKNLIV